MISLVIHRDDVAESDLFRLALIMTVDLEGMLPTETRDIELTSTFCWPLEDDSRENLRDGAGKPSEDFVTLTLHPLVPISFVLFDIPLGKARPHSTLRNSRASLDSGSDREQHFDRHRRRRLCNRPV